MLPKGYQHEAEKGPGLCWVSETFVSEAEMISLTDTKSDHGESVEELEQQGKSKAVKIKPKKPQNTFRAGHHLRVVHKSSFVLLEERTNSILKDVAKISLAAIKSGTLQTAVTMEMFQVPSHEPASFQSIFQMDLNFILPGKLPSVSPLCLSLSFTHTFCHNIFKKEKWIPTLWGFRLWTRDRTKGKKMKFSSRHYLQ